MTGSIHRSNYAKETRYVPGGIAQKPCPSRILKTFNPKVAEKLRQILEEHKAKGAGQ
jgi:hypothetical protein